MSEENKSRDFIREYIDEDLKNGKYKNVHTRFPPEPNGYLHIGHAKAICINFGIAEEYGGLCNLRFDDTNPSKEEQEYVDSIIEDVRWLGFDWDERLFFASDYFEKLYEYAEQLIKSGDAYVCDLTPDDVREYRGTLTEPGKNSPYRDRTVEENLKLFRKMKAGEFPDGSRTLRAKIDMSSPNLNMRDPVMYRILHRPHHRQGDKWCIYPMYDWAHGLEDSIEGITHSLCDINYENHRPLYDWFLVKLGVYRPRQIEFARLNLTNTVLSKRYLRKIVENGFVNNWDDPRMPTLSGLRRRGYTQESIRAFCDHIGVSKTESTVDIALLEHYVRDHLNKSTPRMMGVLNPLKVIIDNYPDDKVEWFDAVNNPEDESYGTRKIPFSKEIYIERSDFMENPPKKYFRLYPGNEVRLKHAYYITCTDVVKDDLGNVVEVHCSYDPESRGGGTPDRRRVRGTLHFVSAKHAISGEVRLYDYLFKKEDPASMIDELPLEELINPESVEILEDCKLEPELANAKPYEKYQFMRKGYFCVDPDSSSEKLVFNRTVSLRDTWAKIKKKMEK